MGGKQLKPKTEKRFVKLKFNSALFNNKGHNFFENLFDLKISPKLNISGTILMPLLQSLVP